MTAPKLKCSNLGAAFHIMKKIAFNLLIILLPLASYGNNLRIWGASLDGNSINFEIAWDNSWNYSEDNGSHDAVWVFAKGKSTSGVWVHIDLETEQNRHFSSNPLAINAVSDGKGVFVFSHNAGTYNISSTQVTIATTTNLSSFEDVRIFGIEMVNVPQGQFYAGDGVSISSLGNSNSNPLLITSEDEIMGETIAIVNPNQEFTPEPIANSIQSSFPKGYSSFYVMKYEVSQIQYTHFLNTLSYNQQASRTEYPPSSQRGTFAMTNPYQPDSLFRNGIAIKVSGTPTGSPAVYALDGNKNGVFNEDNDGLHRAANLLSWGDLSAYLDWASLRPLTELEFEKACRGAGINPIAGEFAWGTSEITNANNPENDGTVFETVIDTPTSGSGLANHGNIIAADDWGLRGVLRTGFAANESSTRLEAGAAYYGLMEMSGNVWEQTIMIGGGGEQYSGKPGDGQLNADGNANEANWCNPSTASGVLLKGGGWASTISDVGAWRDLAVSDRFYSHLKPSTRRNTVGGRGAR